jgi:hypothetical protein
MLTNVNLISIILIQRVKQNLSRVVGECIILRDGLHLVLVEGKPLFLLLTFHSLFDHCCIHTLFFARSLLMRQDSQEVILDFLSEGIHGLLLVLRQINTGLDLIQWMFQAARLAIKWLQEDNQISWEIHNLDLLSPLVSSDVFALRAQI